MINCAVVCQVRIATRQGQGHKSRRLFLILHISCCEAGDGVLSSVCLRVIWHRLKGNLIVAIVGVAS